MERIRETRELNVWSKQSEPRKEDELIPLEIAAYASNYAMAQVGERCLALRHFVTLELHGAHCDWIAVNAICAHALNMRPDDARQFGWRVGDSWIWTLRWVDGNPLFHNETSSEGWLVLATRNIYDDIVNNLGHFEYRCRVIREHDSEKEEKTWRFDF